MQIEALIQANTAALIENTAVLREILAASGTAPAAATAVKKSRTKAETGPIVVSTPETEAPAVQEPAASDIGTFRGFLVGENLPDTGQGVNPNWTTPEPEPEEPSTSIVPDLPIPELRKVMKEKIKERIFADPAFDAQFKAARKKFGVEIIKDLADDQVAAFYAEVLA